MRGNESVRSVHRRLGIAFAATVVVTVITLAVRGPVWVSYLPLLPLALLFFSGLYMFVLPYVTRRRDRTAGRGTARTDIGKHSLAVWIRQAHRWSAVAFTATVVAATVALAQPGPLVWVSYLPLFPLLGLLLSGLSMVVLSYAGKRRATGDPAGASAGEATESSFTTR
ncbi:hypothetical protein [Nocardia sp. BMG51109]|uniref:hypothetical protein n=1 Tax=Nocardia sp. BMG51109 TaxID=1056816 RepID=UPI0004ADEA77|nr:hypothetical protein [Nocardia sp. BMG51109]